MGENNSDTPINGPATAGVVAAGVGCLVLGALTIAAEASESVHRLLEIAPASGTLGARYDRRVDGVVGGAPCALASPRTALAASGRRGGDPDRAGTARNVPAVLLSVRLIPEAPLPANCARSLDSGPVITYISCLDNVLPLARAPSGGMSDT